MALTAKMLKGLGLTDEQREASLEEHANTVNEIKAERDRLKADAEKLPNVQRQLDELKAAGDDGFEAKYNAEKKAFADYKAEVTAKETKAAKEKAVRAYFESKNITGVNLELAMRGCGEEMAALELTDGKIKDTASLDALVNGTYKGLVSTTTTQGSGAATPPANAGNGGNYGLLDGTRPRDTLTRQELAAGPGNQHIKRAVEDACLPRPNAAEFLSQNPARG